MKTRRIASSLALAAAVALGASGCGFITPQATTHVYAPSDGVNVTVEQVAVRNLLLVADESGENFNVVFTAVNSGSTPVVVRFTFVSEDGGSQATAEFQLEPGTNKFGNPEGDNPVTLVSIKGAQAGGAVTAFVESAAGGEEETVVPLIDGTGELKEYADYVINASQLRKIEAAEKKQSEQSDQADGSTAEGEAAEGEAETAE